MKKLSLLCLFLCAAAAAWSQPCTDLFFSEYIEGSSNNKALEIYNPSGSAINLANYTLYRSNNGGTVPPDTFVLHGTLAAGAVYIVANPSAAAAVTSIANDTDAITFFNGDDAIALVKNPHDTLDIIGVWGVDPGTNWPVDTGSTLDHSLVRRRTVHEGTTNWAISSGQWIAYGRDDFSHLGSHTMDPCAPIVDTIISFASATGSVNESAGTYNITVILNQAASRSISADVSLSSGTIADITGFTTTTVTFPAGSTSQTVSVPITNDTIMEPDEFFTFSINNISSGISLGADSVFTLTILANDAPLPYYPIGTVTTVNATTGVQDSVNVACELRGTVYGVNLRASVAGFQFTLFDGTGGVAVYSGSRTYGYTVHEGDSVSVTGKVVNYNGLAQFTMSPSDTIILRGAGTLVAPTVVTALDESTESRLVRINGVHLLTPSQWDTTGHSSGFTCDISNGTSTFALRIDNDVNCFTATRPAYWFDVIGIGSQFDNTSPYTAGYQLMPRYNPDIILRTGIENEANNTEMFLFPNPTEGNSTLRIDAKVAEQVNVVLRDMQGREIWTKSIETHNGSNDITVKRDNLSAGVYTIQVSGENSNRTLRLIMK